MAMHQPDPVAARAAGKIRMPPKQGRLGLVRQRTGRIGPGMGHRQAVFLPKQRQTAKPGLHPLGHRSAQAICEGVKAGGGGCAFGAPFHTETRKRLGPAVPIQRASQRAGSGRKSSSIRS